VGSYPVMGQGVCVSLIGRDGDPGVTVKVGDVAEEVEREVGGTVVSEEEVARKKGERAGTAKEEQGQGQGQLSSSKL
jgi:hypothetical protein